MKIAYFAEEFPHPTETWVHHEIKSFLKLGADIRVFSTITMPLNLTIEKQDLVANTVYISWSRILRFFRPKVITAVIANVALVFRSLLFDCQTMWQRIQILRSLVHFVCFYDEVKSFAPDIIYVHFAGSRANLGLLFSERLKTHFFIKMHAIDCWNRMAMLRVKAERATEVLVTSKFAKRYLEEHYCDISWNLRVHHTGIPIDYFSMRSNPDTGIHENKLRIASIGRLVPKKGFNTLIECSPILKQKGVSHQIDIYGGGSEKENLSHLTRRLAVEDVVALKGVVTQDEIKNALLTASIFVLPCTWDKKGNDLDGIPHVLMEAMAMGVPVISTTAAGIPELVDDGENGLLSDPDSPKGIADQLSIFAVMPDNQRCEMVTSAREKIEHEFATAVVTNELYEIFRSHQNGTNH